MFIELTPANSDNKTIININKIIRIYKSSQTENTVIEIGESQKTFPFKETYDQIKSLIEQAIGDGIPSHDNSSSSYENNTLTSF